MHAWAPLLLSGAALLVVTGFAKIVRPAPTVTALRGVGLSRVGPRTVRALSAAEIAVGVAALSVGGRVAAAAVATTYLAFTAFLLRALRRPLASCGCAGAADTPPTTAHLAMTVMYVVVAVTATVRGGGDGLAGLADSSLPRGAAALALVALTTWLAWAVLTVAPRLLVPARQSSS
jgi:hypothetical protein